MGIYSPDGDVDSYGAEEVTLRTSSGVELLGQKVQAASLPVVLASDHTTLPVAITDGTDSLTVNSDGSINVQVGNIITPPTGVAVSTNVFGQVNSTAGVDTYYVITNGKTLTLQRFTGGAEPHQSGSIVELFYDSLGNSSALVRIETVFVNGMSIQVGISQSFTGNGTRRIVMRRRVYASAAREVWGRWEGYEL